MSVRALHVTSDPYPQRREWTIAPWADRVLARAGYWVQQKLIDTSWRAERFVRMVRAEQRDIENLGSAEGYAREQQLVQRSLRKHGLKNRRALARALALVCIRAPRCLGVAPYDNQVRAAFHLLCGRAVEMDTGEGKTLTAGLAATVAAMAGLRVHVVTANDYLAERDAQELRVLYADFGFDVAAVLEDTDIQARASLYQQPIVYCNNKTVAFDYLRDRVAFDQRTDALRLVLDKFLGHRRQVTLSGLPFAILDEIDSVLIDEGRTPLILSRTVEDDEQLHFLRQALELASHMREGQHFVLHPVHHQPRLSELGADYLQDAARNLCGEQALWNSVRRREEVVQQALHALHGLRRDIHYVVMDDKVQIVDQQTGRVMADRSWEMGLHQLVELKEGVEMTGSRQTLARISFQMFFRRYLGICGMSGTCRDLSGEFADIYAMPSKRVPPRLRNRRKSYGARIFSTDQLQQKAICAAVQKQLGLGRPVLVGTRTVQASERLSQALHDAGVSHQLLNAKQDAFEAECIAQAGRVGAVTIATNMAGRGTDIKLEEQAREAGGLHVIVTELHDNKRVQRQLVGRCARQGDPGSWELLLSTHDELLSHESPALARLLPMLACNTGWRGPRHGLAMALLHGFHLAMEMRHKRMRMELFESDFDRRDALGFAGMSE